MATPEELLAAAGKGETAILFIQEMLVDVFGILIPGFCFIVLSIVALGLPSFDLGVEVGSLQNLTELFSVFEKNSTVVLISILLFSFVVGHLLYRQAQKSRI